MVATENENSPNQNPATLALEILESLHQWLQSVNMVPETQEAFTRTEILVLRNNKKYLSERVTSLETKLSIQSNDKRNLSHEIERLKNENQKNKD